MHEISDPSRIAEKSTLFLRFASCKHKLVSMFCKPFAFWKLKLNFNVFLFIDWLARRKKCQLFFHFYGYFCMFATVLSFDGDEKKWVSLRKIVHCSGKMNEIWKIQKLYKNQSYIHSFGVNVWRSVRHIAMNIDC